MTGTPIKRPSHKRASHNTWTTGIFRNQADFISVRGADVVPSSNLTRARPGTAVETQTIQELPGAKTDDLQIDTMPATHPRIT